MVTCIGGLSSIIVCMLGAGAASLGADGPACTTAPAGASMQRLSASQYQSVGSLLRIAPPAYCVGVHMTLSKAAAVSEHALSGSAWDAKSALQHEATCNLDNVKDLGRRSDLCLLHALMIQLDASLSSAPSAHQVLSK